MIKVTNLHGKIFMINADLIELIETMPDTIITLTTGKKIIVRESTEEILQKVVEFKRQIHPIKIKQN